MAKVIERGNVAEHSAQALIFGDPRDFNAAELASLEARYPGLQATHAELASDPEWRVGKLCPVNFGSDDKPQTVIYACLGERGYFGIRECLRKLAAKAKDLGIRHVACGRLGSGVGDVQFGALEPVVAAAEGGVLAVDIYKGEVQ